MAKATTKKRKVIVESTGEAHISATFKVTFKITDRALYEEMEENDSAIIEFLTADDLGNVALI